MSRQEYPSRPLNILSTGFSERRSLTAVRRGARFSFKSAPSRPLDILYTGFSEGRCFTAVLDVCH